MKKDELTLVRPCFILKEHGLYGFKLGNQYLAGMPMPGSDPGLFNDLASLGIKHNFCTTHDEAPYDSTPLTQLSVKLADSVKGLSEKELLAEEKKIRFLVERMTEVLQQGGSGVCHCKGGTGRTGTLMAGTLMQLGYPTDQILKAMEEINVFRGKGEHGWPELDWQMQLIANW
ncbi:MAG: tyrosine-protein phosphatase [Spirochaetaceae bacterium]|jgi:hypothetical protein|nr:tyrosine-protein phosphatase [Spirochaetaceae bacterium]